MSKSDFLSWDDDINDFDLEELLGDFTDNENYNVCFDSDSEFNENSVPSKKAKKAKNDMHLQQKSVYICPKCDKVLKTISGFRGHTSKQHGLSGLKASDHRQIATAAADTQDISSAPSDVHVPTPTISTETATTGDDELEYQTNACPSNDAASNTSSVSTTTTKDKTKKVFFDQETFHSCFHGVYQAAVKNVINDPMNNLFGTSEIVKVAELAQGSHDVQNHFEEVFWGIFSQAVDVCYARDREQLFNNLHKNRVDTKIRDSCKDLFFKLGYVDEGSVMDFVQVFVLEVMNELLAEQLRKEKKRSEVKANELTNNEQTMLFYVSGFVICQLRKKYTRCKLTKSAVKLDCVKCMMSTSSEKTFVSKYERWFSKSNRGGLLKPSDQFFLLVREMETVVRQHVDYNDLSSNSLRCDRLKEAIMESYMIKYYSNKLFSSVSGDIVVEVTEDIVRLFLTVRGFAVARLARNKFVKQAAKSSKAAKKSASLRQALKSRN